MKKILYVEDNIDTASAVKAILSNVGFETHTVTCGKDCLEKAKEGFDLFLLDIMLPDMSGWAIFENLLRQGTHKVAFLSAIPISNERLRELKGAGIKDYITKPFSKDDLINRVKQILEIN